MGRGRNGLIRRCNDSDNDMDSSEDEAREEMIDDRNFWRRMYRIFGKAWKMARKWLRNASIAIGSMVRVAWYRVQKLSRRKGAMKRFVRDLNENWNELMEPIPVSDTEDNDDGKLSTKEANNSNCFPSILSDDAEPKKKRFKKSTALLMYEWAKNKPEYEEEKERYRQLNFINYSEETIEKLAFFKFSSKHNSEDRIKLEKYKEERQKEWNEMKKRKREQMRPSNGLNWWQWWQFKQWARCEFERRKQEDRIKRKQEVQKMRQQYLADGGEEFFEIK